MFPPGLLVIHDTGGGGEDDETELTRWQQVDNPLLEVTDADVVAGGDDTALVETTVELDNDLAGAVVIDFLEFTDVSVLLHDGQELDDDLGGRSDHDLTLSGLFGIVDRLQAVVENRSLNHFGGRSLEDVKVKSKKLIREGGFVGGGRPWWLLAGVVMS